MCALLISGLHSSDAPAATFDKIVEGKDVLAKARTGTGKTLAFVLPLSQLLVAQGGKRQRAPRALVLAPTRELAQQVPLALAPVVFVAHRGCRHAASLRALPAARSRLCPYMAAPRTKPKVRLRCSCYG